MDFTTSFLNEFKTEIDLFSSLLAETKVELYSKDMSAFSDSLFSFNRFLSTCLEKTESLFQENATLREEIDGHRLSREKKTENFELYSNEFNNLNQKYGQAREEVAVLNV